MANLFYINKYFHLLFFIFFKKLTFLIKKISHLFFFYTYNFFLINIKNITTLFLNYYYLKKNNHLNLLKNKKKNVMKLSKKLIYTRKVEILPLRYKFKFLKSRHVIGIQDDNKEEEEEEFEVDRVYNPIYKKKNRPLKNFYKFFFL